jgi:hypothetical protein
MDSDIKILSKKNSKDERNFKSDEEIKAHFVERLNERYNILLSDEDYNDLHHPKGFTKSKLIEGQVINWAKISSNTSAIIIKVKGKFILAIYSKRRGRFITALPWESYDDETRLVPKIFKKLNIKEFAIQRYNEILSICAKEYVDLGSETKNWHHFQTCTYPHLLMAEYKGRLTVGSIYNKVLKELITKENDLIETV